MPISECRKAFSFPKSEKIKLKKQIETLFRNGKASQFEHFRFIWMLGDTTDSSKIKFGVSVPKKKIRKAHDRNTSKRRIREAWRLHQHQLKELIPEGKTLFVFLIYTYSFPPAFNHAERCIKSGIGKLAHMVRPPELPHTET